MAGRRRGEAGPELRVAGGSADAQCCPRGCARMRGAAEGGCEGAAVGCAAPVLAREAMAPHGLNTASEGVLQVEERAAVFS